MKFNRIKNLTLSLLLCTGFIPFDTDFGNVFPIFSSFAQDQFVTVQAQAAIVGNNKDSAYKKALADAFRNAVEKGLGVWVKSQSQVQNFELKKDEILTRSEGYVLEHEVLNEVEEGGIITLTVKAKVAVDKIGADLKQLVNRVKTQMNNPSVTFVLTTWERKGIKTTVNSNQSNETNLEVNASEGVQAVNSVDTGEQSYIEAVSNQPNMKVSTLSKVKRELSVQKIDENVWKKYPDMTIIDSFQQEFIEKGFDLKATDNAREIALSESIAKTSIDVNDRKMIREAGEKEGANYITRGELQIIDATFNENTGNYVVTSKVGVEIIDVNSGDIVASYSNTASASSNSPENAKTQSIKKVTVLAAKTLASQTIDKWQDRANNGMKFTIEIRNIVSARSQKLPFLKALKSVAQITSQTSPQNNILLLDVMYRGKKDELGEAIIEALSSEKGFSENEFEGPEDEGGKVIFRFTHTKK